MILLNNFKEYYFDSNFEWLPDKDFCLFKNFPIQKLVFADFTQKVKESNLSCTSLWLIRYNRYVKYLINSNINWFLDTDISTYEDRCHFSERIKNCNKTNFMLKNKTSSHSPLEFLLFPEFLLIISQTIISFWGIILNSLVIVVIKNKIYQKGLENKLETYLVMYSFFNILVCLFQILSLLNECQMPFGLFCSSTRQFLFFQYYKIVFGEFFLNFSISMSNCAYIAFALNRLFLVGTKHSKLIQFFAEVGIVKLTIAFVAYSTIFSLFKPLSYSINKYYYLFNFYLGFPFSINNGIIGWARSKFNIVKFFFNVFYEFFNFFMMVIINLIVDLTLLKKIRAVFKEKEEKMKDQSKQFIEKMKKEKEKSIREVTKFVVFNSIINIVLKIPICISTFNDFRVLVFNFHYLTNYKSFFEKDWFSTRYSMKYFCYLSKSCEVFEKFGHILFSFSFLINFFVLRRFNIKFKQAFEGIFYKNNKQNAKTQDFQS